MTARVLLFSLLISFSSIIHGQNNIPDSLALLFQEQLEVFPQEKIYLHTDKPYYISGEKIWFRAHLVDAATHFPVSYSRYVYVELIDPLDSIVVRVKIREEEEAYHGYLPIPDDVPEGDYTMRAYTTFMQSQDENYFFTKTIYIGNLQARSIRTETQFTISSGRRERVDVTFRFSHVSISAPLVPKSVKISVNDGRMMNVDVDDDGTVRINFNLSADSRKRIILLEVVVFSNPYRQFIQIPTQDDDFDVSFFPEGGSLMQGTSCIVGFKAMKSNGQATNISGVVYDHAGTEIQRIESEHLGMGRFVLHAEKGKNYYAVCQNDKGQTKRFDLPASINHGYALNVSQVKDRIYVSVLKPAENAQNSDLYLLAHTRGMVHYVDILEHDQPFVVFLKDHFPSGILHFILFDSGLNPVSERLFFINNQDQAQVTYQSDKENYTARSLAINRITLTDSEGEPLTGSFSVAVTSDSEVTPDSTSSILSQLLLSSDLRGNIENPAYYFQNTPTSAYALDLLMLTQGWRRYNIVELAQSRFTQPTMPVEIGHEFSGYVKSVSLNRPVEDVEVTSVSFTGGLVGSAKTDKDGRFHLPVGEFPDSTLLMISIDPKRRMTRMVLQLDEESFPKRTLSAALTSEVDKYSFAKYADNAEQIYNENAIRMYELPEVTIAAQQVSSRRSHFYSIPNNTVTEEELEKLGYIDVYSVLRRIPGVQLVNNASPPPTYIIVIRGTKSIYIDDNASTYNVNIHPLVLINNTPLDITILDDISFFDIAQIDVLKGTNAAIFGSRGANGVIAIYTKTGISQSSKIASQVFHSKALLPLGYQKPVEFYAPKYDTPQSRNSAKPDLRTTIHWQPVIQTDSEGVAAFEFYTADKQTSYTVVIEGLADNGSIIRKEEKLWRKDE